MNGGGNVRLSEIRAAVIGVGFIGVAHVEALRRLGVDVKTIRNRLRSYGIQMPGR